MNLCQQGNCRVKRALHQQLTATCLGSAAPRRGSGTNAARLLPLPLLLLLLLLASPPSLPPLLLLLLPALLLSAKLPLALLLPL